VNFSNQRLENCQAVYLSEKVHGFEHTEKVEKLVKDIAKEPEFFHTELDSPVLRAAALLHDIGYSRFRSAWKHG
jgi:HD superfamily phosphodiesterase